MTRMHHRSSSRLNVLLTLPLAMSLLLGGCVTRGTLDEIVAERDAARADSDRLTEANRLLQSKTLALSATAVVLSKELALQDREIAQLDREQQELADEMARWAVLGAVKMVLLADGLHLLLPNEVLFDSGSSRLSAQGDKLVTELAAEIMPQPYEIAVVGFTDNVPVGPRLAERYPSNWELAGARAASVVRVMEREGVAIEQMLAVSRGQGGAIASNDTDEGRAQNRRIDVRLRPILSE